MQFLKYFILLKKNDLINILRRFLMAMTSPPHQHLTVFLLTSSIAHNFVENSKYFAISSLLFLCLGQKLVFEYFLPKNRKILFFWHFNLQFKLRESALKIN